MNKRIFSTLLTKNTISPSELKELKAFSKKYPFSYIPKLKYAFHVYKKGQKKDTPLIKELALQTPSNFLLWEKLNASKIFDHKKKAKKKPKDNFQSRQEKHEKQKDDVYSWEVWLKMNQKASIEFAHQPNATKKNDTIQPISETLAGIYSKQGYIDEAIAMYEKLSMKFPQKSAYFAERIKNIKK